MSGDWRVRAACRSGVDPETFFPASDSGPDYEAQVAAAKAVCARCPVRAACLDEALARIPYGIAGGLTPEERRTRRPAARVIADVVECGLLPGAPRHEREAAGQVLLTAGHPVDEVARRCGVTPRTASRWAARVRTAMAEGSAGGNRAPLLISHTHSTQAGTRTLEGHRS
jgi:Transcription factor WhiB/Homeodomain-like domain